MSASRVITLVASGLVIGGAVSYVHQQAAQAQATVEAEAEAKASGQVISNTPEPKLQADGSVVVPPFVLPASPYMSEESKQILQFRAMMPARSRIQEPDAIKARQDLVELLKRQVDMMLENHPVNVEESSIADIPVRIITPKNKTADSERVLINLHGGAFNTCWESCSILESAPLADVGGYKVVSVNYRMAPEAKHPAGLEDSVKVYKELLKTHSPEKIGIYGCSAGGALTSQTAAYAAQNDLPEPAAIGIFAAGGVDFGTGDSAYIAGYVDGMLPPPNPDGSQADLTRGYFDGSDKSDAIISPALHPEVISQFPPTLLVTGSRAMDLSPAIFTNTQLLKAGVDSTLHVAEAMGHCFWYTAALPESQEAYQIMAGFFQRHLQ